QPHPHRFRALHGNGGPAEEGRRGRPGLGAREGHAAAGLEGAARVSSATSSGVTTDRAAPRSAPSSCTCPVPSPPLALPAPPPAGLAGAGSLPAPPPRPSV